ncbi:MAG TPA: hypothetical protein VMZ91_12790 [Candidatus Paceibacterota bacterium]|nr:hypothetical protein [Candidatus Paceibacterota bacterium]
MRKEQRRVRPYKFIRKDGSWSIIAADDESSAENVFMSENKIETKQQLRGYMERVEIANMKEMVPFQFSSRKISIGSIIKGCRFFPRCICDSEDDFIGMPIVVPPESLRELYLDTD